MSTSQPPSPPGRPPDTPPGVPPDAPPHPPPDPPPRPSPTSAFLEKAALVGAPGVIAFALLYYFGSLYTKAYYSALGVLPEDLGFSVQGIVANSTSAVLLPLCALLLGGLVMFLVLGWLGRALAGPARAVRRRAAITWLLVSGVVMMLIGLPVFFTDVSLFPEGLPRRFLPGLSVVVGATLAVFAVHLRLAEDGGARVRKTSPGDRLWLGAGTLLIGLLTLGLFYDMALFVADVGRGDAILDAEQGYRGNPYVVVHSRVPLRHNAPEIEFMDHGSASAPFRYEYRGFRILAKAPARYYLISHTARSYADRHVVVLPDDGTAWLEIRAA